MPIVPPRIAAWLALASLVAAWAALDAAIQPTREYVLVSLQLSEPRAVVATRALFNVTLLWIASGVAVLLSGLAGSHLLTSDGGDRHRGAAGCLRRADGLLRGRGVGLGRGSTTAIRLVVLSCVAGHCLGAVRGRMWRSDLSVDSSSIRRAMPDCQCRFDCCFRPLCSESPCHASVRAGNPAVPGIGIILAVTGATALLGVAFSGVYFASGQSLTPAIAAHTAIDVILQPGVLLLVSGA